LTRKAIAFDLASLVTVDPLGGSWPDALTARRAIEAMRILASPADLQAAARFALVHDTPRWRLETLRQAADQIAFRLGASSSPRAAAALVGLLRECPVAVLRDDAPDVLNLGLAHKLRVCVFSAIPPFLCEAAEKAVAACAERLVLAGREGIPAWTPEFYLRLSERLLLRPQEVCVVGSDPVLHVAAARKAGLRTVLVHPEGAGRPPRCGQSATAPSMISAVAAAESVTSRRPK
jgi:FMN phosphatase YigB (HAD superfamily)